MDATHGSGFIGQTEYIMDAVQSQAAPVRATPEWRVSTELPWLSRNAPGAAELQLCLRLVESTAVATSLEDYLKHELPEVGAEFAAQWVAVLASGREWERLGEFGRQPMENLPAHFMTEALDRDAGGFLVVDGAKSTGWGLCAAPLHKPGELSELLVVCGRGLTAKSLSSIMAAARALGLAAAMLHRHDATTLRIDRLRSTLKIASQLGTAKETKTLLEMIAREAARLLDTDRASIFIWDRPHREMVACPALGVEGNVLRLPDNLGIVGECLQSGQSIRVDDAYHDSRFNKQVDLDTGYRTRNLLCVPLVDATGQRVGVFEAINKLRGDFTPEDEESLSELGIQAATAIENTREREHLVKRHKQLTDQVTQGVQIIGSSPAIAALRATIDRLATTDLPVLILGESGTGKEVVAQSLHYRGSRQDHPFIAVNCAALTETLLESELFGHEKGAFTDARDTRQGKFELAEGGTLFLDEIGDMSPGGQAKLLRVLEQKVITRVGGSQNIRVNVRVVAATNVNLAAAVREKKFREDLYYRLSVVALELPALRDRPEDILPLAEFFLERFSIQASRRPLAISQDARRRLQAHAWPGNVRELRNLMERVAFLSSHERVEVDDLAFILNPDQEPEDLEEGAAELATATCRFQSLHIRRIVKRVNGNMTDAAAILGLHRSNLYRKMRQLGMKEARDVGE
jgi:transcriptional regulator with GAF, ATPase, and Fis domain